MWNTSSLNFGRGPKATGANFPKSHSEIPGDQGRAAKPASGMRHIQAGKRVSLEGLC